MDKDVLIDGETTAEREFYDLVESGGAAYAKMLALEATTDAQGKAFGAADLARRRDLAGREATTMERIETRMTELQSSHAELPRAFDTATLTALRTRLASLKVTGAELEVRARRKTLFGVLVADHMSTELNEHKDAIRSLVQKIRGIEAKFEDGDVAG